MQFLKYTWCLTSTEIIRLIRDGKKGLSRWGQRDGEVGAEVAYRYTVTTRMTPALRWAAMRAVLMFISCEGQSHNLNNVHRPQLFKRKESRFEPRSFCLPG